jgi:hypothetical protein
MPTKASPAWHGRTTRGLAVSADIAFGLLTGFLLGALAGMSLEAGLNQTAWRRNSGRADISAHPTRVCCRRSAAGYLSSGGSPEPPIHAGLPRTELFRRHPGAGEGKSEDCSGCCADEHVHPAARARDRAIRQPAGKATRRGRSGLNSPVIDPRRLIEPPAEQLTVEFGQSRGRVSVYFEMSDQAGQCSLPRLYYRFI